MKKSIILILIACISVVFVCSCHYSEESEHPTIGETTDIINVTTEGIASEEVSAGYLKNTAYIWTSQIMGGSGKRVNVINEYKNLSPIDISAPTQTECAFTIMGKPYDGKFLRTDVVNFNTPAYVYKATDGTQVTIDQNGNIIGVDTAEFFTYYVAYPDPNDLLSENEYNDCAIEYLNSIYGKGIASRYSIYNTTMYTNIIKVYFSANDLNDIELTTNDKIMISLDINGNLLGYYGSCVGLYDNKTVPENFCNDSIIEKIRTSLAENNNQIEIHNEKKLVILSDGRMACYANFRLVDGDKAGEWAKVLIPLE